jgi:hypothetical protein
MRRRVTAALISSLVACGGTLTAREPLPQEPIGTGVPGGPSATLPTSGPTPGDPASTAGAGTATEPAAGSGSSATPAPTVADLCPPKGQKPELSRFGVKSSCKAAKPRSKQLSDLRSNEQLLASMQPNAPEREELVFRLAQGYALLECSIASACAKSRDASTSPDEIPLAEAKRKTDDYCATMRSDFPKSKRRCP